MPINKVPSGFNSAVAFDGAMVSLPAIISKGLDVFTALSSKTIVPFLPVVKAGEICTTNLP